jgi:hypothetical protein
MIKNDEQLEQTRSAINNLETAILSLKRDVFPINASRYAVMAEPAVDQLLSLRRQVDDYVGVTSAIIEEAELWMRIEGPEVDLGDAPTSVVTTLLELLRRGIQSVAEFLQRGTVGVRPTADMKQACDLRIVGWMPGSVQVGLRLPEGLTRPDDGVDLTSQAREALQLYLEAASWIGSVNDNAFLERRIPDGEKRRLLLRQVARIVPRPRGAAELIEFSGRLVPGQPVRLGREATDRIRRAVSTIVDEELAETAGLLREIDLDGRSFIVRTPDSGGKETKCEIPQDMDDLVEIAKYALDHPVVVRGTRRTDPTRRKVFPLQVEEIDVLDKSDGSIGSDH